MSSTPYRHTYYGGSDTGSNIRNVMGSSSNNEYYHNQHRSSYKGTKRKQVTFGPYIIGPTLGEGEFGKVKLGWSNTGTAEPKNVAIKLIRRDTILKNSDKEVKIYREINALKHLNHPNIVRLEEVLQNSKYIGIVLQYASGGEFYRYIQKKRRLKESSVCRLFAQLISGVSYMHFKKLAHRDLKLENLLLDEHENLIITDFGFVNEFNTNANNDLMKTSCGSPCYAAPELVTTIQPYEARKADIWSCGVILYAMLAGYLPWDDDPENPEGDDIGKLYSYITKSPLKFPEYITPIPRDLLRKILVMNPKRRLDMNQITKHEWLQPHSEFMSLLPEDWDAKAKAEVNNLFRPPPPKSEGAKDYSRPRSNCSTSSTNSKGEKRNSLIMDSTLYSQPVPPKESQSHVMMKSGSPSSEFRSSPIKRSTHSRNNSAASIALQAVVDAEREHFNSSFQLSTPSPSQNDNLLYSLQSSSHSSRLQSFNTARSPVHNGVSSLMNKDSIIIEASPQKSSAPLLLPPTSGEGVHMDKFFLQSSPYPSNTINKQCIFTGITNQSQHQYHLLASSQRSRTRPTSYHPISTTTYNDNRCNESTTSVPLNRFGNAHVSGPTEDELEHINNSLNSSSGNVAQQTSLNMSKPSVDLRIVSGDLIKSDETRDHSAKQIQNQIDNSNIKRGVVKQPQKTQSRNEMVDNSSRTTENLGKNIMNKNTMKVSHQISKTEQSHSIASISKTQKDNVQEKKDNRFSLLSFYSYYNNSKSSFDLNPVSTSKSTSINNLINTTSKKSQKSLKNSQSHSSVSGGRSNDQHFIIGGTNSNSINACNLSTSKPNRYSLINFKSKHFYTEDVTNRQKRASIPLDEFQHPPKHEYSKEPSTGRKILDFFKKRSMRL